MTATILSFKPPNDRKTYRPEFVLFEDRKRRQWAVVERAPDGTETHMAAYGGRKSEAFAMAKLWTEVEARRRRDMELLARDPIGQAALAMTSDQREFMIKVLSAVQHMTG